MDFSLDEALKDVQQKARAVAGEVLRPHAAEADRTGTFVKAQMQALATHGFLGMLVPERDGGLGYGAAAYSVAMTEMAAACASSAVTMAVTNMVGDAIATFGSDEQKARFLPPLVSGELIAGAFALSEPGAGSDAASLKATARRAGSDYILNGGKCWITSGDVAGVVLVMAKTDPSARAKGISAFLVEREAPGLSVGRHEDKMGLRASSTVTLSLEDVRVPESQRLGPEGIGFKVAMRALDGGRIGIASQAVGLGHAALSFAREAAAKAGTSPDASSDGLGGLMDQASEFALADMAMELDAARLLALRAAGLKDRGVPFTKEASMAKLFATEAANRAMQKALAVAGPAGITEDAPLARMLRDVRVTTIYEGTSEIQRLVVGREVLRGA